MWEKNYGEEKAMIIRLTIVCLVILAIIFVALLIESVLFLEAKREEEELEKEKKFKAERKRMCSRTRQANACPGVCSKCAWGDEVYQRGRK